MLPMFVRFHQQGKIAAAPSEARIGRATNATTGRTTAITSGEKKQVDRCESVNLDVVIVEGRTDRDEQEQPPLDEFSLISVGMGHYRLFNRSVLRIIYPRWTIFMGTQRGGGQKYKQYQQVASEEHQQMLIIIINGNQEGDMHERMRTMAFENAVKFQPQSNLLQRN